MRASGIIGAICAVFITATAAQAEMSAAEYFARDKSSNWTGALVNEVRSPYGSLPKTYMPRDRQMVARIVEREAIRQGAPVKVILALTKRESGFNPRARSYQNAQGVMQILPSTWRSTGCSGSIWNAEDNARCGISYFMHGYRTGGLAWAVARYHGGPNTRYHGPKTRAYAAAILGTTTASQARRYVYRTPARKQPISRDIRVAWVQP